MSEETRCADCETEGHVVNDPDKLHASDWFNAVVAVSVAICGGLIAWFASWIKGRRERMRKRIEDFDKVLDDMNKQLAQHDELIAVADTKLEHIKTTVQDVKSNIDGCRKLLDDLLLKMSK